jgi:hypothetical protein
MEAAVGKAFEHKDKSVGESGYSHDGRYRIANEARMKNPETREWMDCIIYSNVDNGSLYVREKDDFFEKFGVEIHDFEDLPQTVNGFIMKELEAFPQPGDGFKFRNLEIEIGKTSTKMVEEIFVKKINEENEED